MQSKGGNSRQRGASSGMGRVWWMKFLFLLGITGLSVVYVTPTLMNLDSTSTRFPFKQKVNLGLDLQGGLYMVLGVDFNKVFKDVVSRQMSQLQESLQEEKIALKAAKLVTENANIEDPQMQIEYEATAGEAIKAQVKKNYSHALRLVSDQPGKLVYGLSQEFRGEVREKTMSQSIEVIRNRIDEFGVAEPAITSQGNDRVVVELPGVKEVERAKELIGRTAKLEFKMVDDKSLSPDQLKELIAKAEKEQNFSFKEGDKFSTYVNKVNEAVKGKIAEGTEIAFERNRDPLAATAAGGEATGAIVPYLLKSKTEVTGDDLQDAVVSFDQETQKPNVSFTLNPRGAALFEKLTGDHLHERLAIVLDNIVHSAPVIQSKIGGGRGQITLGAGTGDTVVKEAKDLAIVLRAGALPAQLEFLEQRVVGPSLGNDSIKKGAFASALGSLAVLLFVIFYYRTSGVIAAMSLVLNVLYVLASLVGMEATLTLPGIAGIALTVGIAVDSNVVIYERIREELRAGKQLVAAVEMGFQKAFRTILDANVTNAAAAVVLLMYGTGPIKGFAVTMLIGIVTTLFTAVFVCQVVFDWYLKRLENKGSTSLSI